MDNITHSLIGAGIGEVAAKRSINMRNWYWLTAILASNVPDADIWIPLLLGQPKITGLLHHRGHTHTYLVSILLAMACYGFVQALALLRGRRFSKKENRTIFLLALLGTVLHIVADSWNSYGVHPYWPFNSNWYYGDFVFIIEPWLWLFLAPALALTVRHRTVQAVLSGIVVLLLVLSWRVPLVHWTTKVALTAASVLLPLFFSRINQSRRIFWAWGFVSLFLIGCWSTKQVVKSTIAKLPGQETLFDAAINPLPGNPFCWSAFVSSREKDQFVVRIATIAAYPSVVDLKSCPKPRPSNPTAPLAAVAMPAPLNLKWWGEFEGSLADLRMLAKKSCQVHALLRFMRMPYWKNTGGDRWMLGDLRFDRDQELGFTEFEFDLRNPGECPPLVPNWTEPLAPLLATGTKTSGASAHN